MGRLTLEALGFTEDDLWREIRDRWRRPEGEPRTDGELRRLFRAQMIEEQARYGPEERFIWTERAIAELWELFSGARAAEGASRDEILREWEADRVVNVRLGGDGG